MYVGKGNGEDFWMNIDQGRGNQVFSAHFGYQRNCKVTYNPESDWLNIVLINCPSLDGDIRVLFETHHPSVPKGYEKCPFYFWFNTALHRSEKLCLKREDLDNPHKPKTWHCFRRSFEVAVTFERKWTFVGKWIKNICVLDYFVRIWINSYIAKQYTYINHTWYAKVNNNANPQTKDKGKT